MLTLLNATIENIILELRFENIILYHIEYGKGMRDLK